MPHKIGHAQQNAQNYFATLMIQPVTLNFGAELLCSFFHWLVLFLPGANNKKKKKEPQPLCFIFHCMMIKRKIKWEELENAVVEGGMQIKLSVCFF